jgi:hypothetical protein
MDERTCTTCAHGEKKANEYPCNVCDSHFSKWEHVDDDEEDDFELIDRGFIGIE